MLNLRKITPLNGFDSTNLFNARQNNYAWSIAELDDYIYVGTGRNIGLWAILSFGKLIPNLKVPVSVNADNMDLRAEIWRYKKDGSSQWEKVFKAPQGIDGFRFMICHKPFNGRAALYAAGTSMTKSNKLDVFKSSNGTNWVSVSWDNLKGNTSRSMIVHENKIYMATAIEGVSTPFLYSSTDPEIYGWHTEVDGSVEIFDKTKNPVGFIYNLASFNGHIYAATGCVDGVQVWRTRGSVPSINDWILIADKGFGDKSKTYPLSVGVFKDHLYVSATTSLPKGFFMPKGCDIVRIDKGDHWELVVGGTAVDPATPSKGLRNPSKSLLPSGFGNPLNLYAWQIQEYKGALLVTTFDHSTNLETILELLLLNKEAIKDLPPILGMDFSKVDEAITKLETMVKLLHSLKYPFGFDMYISYDGLRFTPLTLNGLGNDANYGGRILFVNSKNQLYIGTANPYHGCEIWTDDPLSISIKDISPLSYGVIPSISMASLTKSDIENFDLKFLWDLLNSLQTL